MKKVNVIINKVTSDKVYNNGSYDIRVDGENVILSKEDKIMKSPIPKLDDSNELLICHNEHSIINTIVIHKPKNEIKKLFWRYGFRNEHYCRSKIEMKNRIKKNSQLVYETDNIAIYCAEKTVGVRTRQAADLIYVNFNDVKQYELDRAIFYMTESNMKPMLDSNYVFD